ERLGSTRTLKVDARLIAATNRNLAQMVASGEFREDLYYRLAVFPIQLPPLRERREDIPLLVEYFVARYARRMKKRIKEIPTLTLQAMTDCAWPGNIRAEPKHPNYRHLPGTRLPSGSCAIAHHPP